MIRFSSTVEDTSGCPYVMDELDESFLNKYNTDHTTLSEDDFEKIMYQFESITKEKLPHIHLVSSCFFDLAASSTWSMFRFAGIM